MKRILFFLLFLAFAVPSYAQGWQEARMTLPILSGTVEEVASCSTPAQGNFVNEGFEGDGTENTWVDIGGTTTLGYGSRPGTQSPTSLCAQSGRVVVDAASETGGSYWDYGSQLNDDTYVRLYIYVDSYTIGDTGDYITFFQARETSGGAPYWSLELMQISGVLNVCIKGTTPCQPIAIDAWYRIEVHYIPNSASNVFRVYNAAGSQIGSDENFSTNNGWIQYYYLGAIGNNASSNRLDLYFDLFSVGNLDWIGAGT